MRFRSIQNLLIGLSLWTVCNPGAIGQPVSGSKSYSIANGLPSRNITCVLEDRQGFLWVGTDRGLARFDGSSFYVLKNIGTGSSNLLGQHILHLAEAADGRLLIGTDEGLNILSEDGRRLVALPQNVPQRVQSVIALNRHTVVWTNKSGFFISRKKPSKAIPQTQAFPLKLPDGLPELDYLTVFRVFYIDSTRFLLTSIDGDVWVYNSDGKVHSHFTLKRPFHSAAFDRANFILYVTGTIGDHDPYTIFIDSYNLRGDLIREYRFDDFPVSSHWVSSLFIDRQQNLWAGLFDSEPLFYNSQLDSAFHMNGHQEAMAGFTKLKEVVGMEQDRNGNIWFASSTGLIALNLKKSGFKVFRPLELSSNSLFSCRSIYPVNKKEMLVSAYGGHYFLDTETGRFRTVDFEGGTIGEAPIGTIRAVMKDGENQVLLATEGSGLIKADPNTLQATQALQGPEATALLHCLAQDAEERVWVGAVLGLYFYDETSRSLKLPPGIDSVFNKALLAVNDFYFDADANTLWAATGAGLLEYRLDKSRAVLHPIALRGDVLATTTAHCLFGQDKTIWVGTEASGLMKFDKETKTATHFTTADGLAENTVFSILLSANGDLCLGTINGLSIFSIKSGLFTNYYKEDGLADNEFNKGSAYLAADGRMFMGGINGITMFEPRKLAGHRGTADLTLSRITRHNGKTNQTEELIFGLKDFELEIGPDDRFFTVHFSQRDPFIKDKRFEYKLEGQDQQWQFLGQQQSIRFAGLAPGSYSLRVRKVGDTDWEANGLLLPITVQAAWYNTIWGYLLFISIFIVIVVVIARFRIRQIRLREKAQKQEELDQLKSDFFANISHEFRTPLTLILGPLEKHLKRQQATEDKRDFKLMKRNANRLLTLINQLLDLSKLESGNMKLNVEQGDLAAHLRLITANFESMALQKEISMKLIAETDSILLLYDRDKMEKILYNLLSNAIKFCDHGGEVEVRCETEYDSKVQISVANTGKGIPQKELPKIFNRFHQVEEHTGIGTGVGLALTRQLVELHGGSISVSSIENEKTVFTLELPNSIANPPRVRKPSRVQQQESPTPALPRREGVKVSPLGEDLEGAKHAAEGAALIQIVDDNPDIREYLASILQPHYQLIESADGAEGVEQARQQIPDLVISDLMMPVMNGHELCHRLKTDELTSHIPVILLTAKATRESKIEGLEQGADDYLLKPFDAEELLIRVRNLIAIRQQLKEKYSGQKLVEIKNEPQGVENIFLQKGVEVVEKNLSNEDFSVENLCEALFLSRRQLQRKLKAVSGKSPKTFIRSIRMEHARSMLSNQDMTVSEVSIKVGYTSLSHFSKIFKDEFGVSPSEV